jgi:glucose 1-dehydrogenase
MHALHEESGPGTRAVESPREQHRAGSHQDEFNRAAWEDPAEEAKLLKLVSYGRVGERGDIGPAAARLASDEADYVTGITLFVDGGMLLYPGFRTGG